MAEQNNANIGFEKQIWDTAYVLHGNLDASEYKQGVLDLIFKVHFGSLRRALSRVQGRRRGTRGGYRRVHLAEHLLRSGGRTLGGHSAGGAYRGGRHDEAPPDYGLEGRFVYFGGKAVIFGFSCRVYRAHID